MKSNNARRPNVSMVRTAGQANLCTCQARFKGVLVDDAYTKLISPNPHDANRETLTLAFACVKSVEE